MNERLINQMISAIRAYNAALPEGHEPDLDIARLATLVGKAYQTVYTIVTRSRRFYYVNRVVHVTADYVCQCPNCDGAAKRPVGPVKPAELFERWFKPENRSMPPVQEINDLKLSQTQMLDIFKAMYTLFYETKEQS